MFKDGVDLCKASYGIAMMWIIRCLGEADKLPKAVFHKVYASGELERIRVTWSCKTQPGRPKNLCR
jgi:hypothetical protein